jgi:hypothetical protein
MALALPLTLSTLAVTVDKYGATHTYEAQIVDEGDRRSLWIVGTPGRWLLSSIRDVAPGEVMAIDFGQRWACTNVADLVAEARRLIINDLLINH